MLHDHRSNKISFAPVGKELDKLVDDQAEEAEKTRHLPSPIYGYQYEVTFTNIQYNKKYAELELMTADTNTDIRNKVYELSFTQHKAMVGKKRGISAGLAHNANASKYVWLRTSSSDDDLNMFSAATASDIIGTVVTIAKEFEKDQKPRGIIFGSKVTANPARGRIYKMLAKRTAAAVGGTVIDINARYDMKDGGIVWLDKQNPFVLPGLPIKEDYGAVLFEPQRRTSKKAPEKNTKDEEELWNALQQHYFGGRDAALAKELPTLLASKKKHDDVLSVPSKHEYAYRLLSDMTANDLMKLFRVKVGATGKGTTSGGTYTNKKYGVSSWTVDLGIMPALLKDFGGTMYDRNTDAYHVMLVSKLGNNRDAFIMNPNAYHEIPTMAGQFSYQQEIISIDSVKIYKAVYCNKKEFGGDPVVILDWLTRMAAK